jgi:hypothetical protein
VIAAVAVVAALVGWQVGAHVATARTDETAGTPAVLAWLVDNGPNVGSTTKDPAKDLELHVANLGAEPIRIVSVTPHTRQNPVTLEMAALSREPVTTGQSTVVAMIAHAACRAAYTGSSLTVGLVRTGAQGQDEPVDVPVVSDSAIGTSLPAALNSLCAQPSSGAGGVDDVYVQSTFTAADATLVLTNRSDTGRKVSFAAPPSTVFDLVTAPPGTLVLGPGGSRSVTVHAAVKSCHDLFTLGQWAAGVHLEVRRQNAGVEASADASAPATLPLEGMLLASLGASVEKACGTPLG